MDIIIADARGAELGYLTQRREMDVEIGGDNTFEILIDGAECRPEYTAWCRWYVPGGEIGGLITDIEKQADGYVALRGDVWRGLLNRKILCPAAGETEQKVSGELNAVIAQLIAGRFGDLAAADTTSTGITVENYLFPYCCTLLAGLERMLGEKGHRLSLRYNAVDKKLYVGAVPVTDHSARLEYGSDSRVQFASRQYWGTTHLICLGNDETDRRLIRHLYVQPDGTITQAAAYSGLEEREAVLDFSNAKSEEELLEKGREALEKEKSYTSMSFYFNGEEMDIPIGDIVGGRDRSAGLEIKKPIVRKIIRVNGLSDSIECEVGD